MDNRLRRALEQRGLPVDASEIDAREFYLQVRAQPHDPDLTTRSIQLRAQTIDDDKRSVEATIATDQPVEVWDWKRGETVDEILTITGARLPDQLPMLATHNRWDLDALLGSGRNLRREDGGIVARLFFARDDEEADKAWNKARQGHLVDTSVGYHVDESVLIEPGQTTDVAGRKFTARQRALRIATVWTPKEVSLVPIGADQAAKLREQSTLSQRGPKMDPKLREYLETIGLRAEASDEQAEKFYQSLAGEQRGKADEIKTAKRSPADPPLSKPEPPANRETREGSLPPAFQEDMTPPTDTATIVRQALADERDRVRQIEDLAGDDVPDNVRQQAVHEGWDLDRAGREFLPAVRKARSLSLETFTGGGPAIHSRSHEADCNVRSLAAGLLVQNGLDPTKCSDYDTKRSRDGALFSEQDADRGDEFSRLSAIDICREAVLIDTGRYIRDPDESIRAALSGGTLSYVFGTNIYAKLVAGWTEAADSTIGWCDEEDVPNFLSQEEISLNVDGTPELHGRGDTATDITFADKHETYRAYRFTKKATIDDQDIKNDRLGALMKLPTEMGRAFRRMRANMVYSTILANAALVADSKAVFHADHSNSATAALGSTGLAAGLTAMANQRIGSGDSADQEPLNIQARYLIVPTDLRFTAATLLNSVALAKTHADASDAAYMPVNPVGPQVLRQVIGDDLTLVSDSRLGATGCWNPMTKAMVTGSASRWYLSAGPYRGVRLVFVRGANRQPAVRNYVLDKGEWGIGWDMLFDIGCKIMDYRGLYYSTGAG